MDVTKYFSEDSPLVSLIPDFKVRKYQQQLSEFINKTFENYETSIIEAPTGSGKTLAYLIPAFLSDKKIIISTKSKQLMNQLFYKDVKNLQELNFFDKDVSVLKGKKNYFCIYRYAKYILPYGLEYPDVIDWYDKNKHIEGLEVPYYKFDEITYDKITADSFQCLSSKCEYYDRCHFYRAKERANLSDIVVTNHFLLLTDIASKSKSGYLSNFEGFDHIIFDEAHSIVDIFPMFAGEEVSVSNLKGFLKDSKSNINNELYVNITNKIRLFEANIKTKQPLLKKHMDAFENILDFIKSNILKNCEDEEVETFKKIEKGYEYILNHDGVKLVEPNAKSISIKLLPLKIDDIFYEGLVKTCISATFISATLTSNNTFDFFKKELGLPEDVLEYSVDKNSIEKKSVYVIPKSITNKKDYYTEVVSKINAPILIIFNSIKMMHEVYEVLKIGVKNKNIILQQNINIGEFLADSSDVVLGCAVLREGIDIKTNSKNKCVIIDKLPFENIGDVYLKMRAEAIEKSGKNPFMDFYLPRAVIFFKQSVGRLIRNEDDYGVCIILDNRIIQKNYGKYFLESIDVNKIYSNLDDALKFLEEEYEQC